MEQSNGQERAKTKILIKRFVHQFLRGCSKGIGVQAGLSVISALLRNPFRKSLPHIWENVWSKSCLQLALFCGLYPSVYHLCVDLLASCRNKRDGWNYGLSGAIAGLSIAVLDETRRNELVFYTVSRALSAGVLTLVTRGYLPYIPMTEVAVFVACTSLIVYCTALHPEYLNSGYYRSIVKWSRDYTDENLTFLFRRPAARFLTCQEGDLHQHGCLRHHVTDFMYSLPLFAKIYFPIHLAPIVLFRRKLFKDRPLYVVRSFLKNMTISTTFLGVMVVIAKLTICLLRNMVHIPPPLPGFIPTVAGALCGLALLIERRSRRNELAQFVIPHTLNILYIFAQRSKLGSKVRIPHGFTLVFALSMMSVMHAFEIETDSLTLLSTGILRFFVGNQHRNEYPSHSSSLSNNNVKNNNYCNTDNNNI